MDRASGLANLLHAYEQWKTYHDVDASIAGLVADGTWPSKPKKEDVIEIFAASSTWYKSYEKLFAPVNNYPALRKWLDEADDAPSGADLFGISKRLYTFTDLMDYYTREKARKGKGKRAVGSDEESPDKRVKKVKRVEKGRKRAESSKQRRMSS